MNMMKQSFLYLIAVLVLISCESEVAQKNTTDKVGGKSEIESQVTDFSDTEFDDPKCLELLQELDLYTDFLNFVCCKYFVPISDLYALVFCNVMQSFEFNPVQLLACIFCFFM